jgi:hypothetical protein
MLDRSASARPAQQLLRNHIERDNIAVTVLPLSHLRPVKSQGDRAPFNLFIESERVGTLIDKIRNAKRAVARYSRLRQRNPNFGQRTQGLTRMLLTCLRATRSHSVATSTLGQLEVF